MSRIFAWNETCLVGQTEIDRAHLAIWGHLRAVETQLRQNADRTLVSDNLNRLLTEIRIHFRFEEDLMQDAGFPELQEHYLFHKQAHDNVLRLTAKVKHAVEDGMTLEMTRQEFEKLSDAFLKELLRYDYEMYGMMLRSGYLGPDTDLDAATAKTANVTLSS